MRSDRSGKSVLAEYKGKSALDCETDTSSRYEVGLSDPVVLYGRAIALRIKGTPGITG